MLENQNEHFYIYFLNLFLNGEERFYIFFIIIIIKNYRLALLYYLLYSYYSFWFFYNFIFFFITVGWSFNHTGFIFIRAVLGIGKITLSFRWICLIPHFFGSWKEYSFAFYIFRKRFDFHGKCAQKPTKFGNFFISIGYMTWSRTFNNQHMQFN